MSSIFYSVGKFIGKNRILTATGLVFFLGTCTYVQKSAEEANQAASKRSIALAAEDAAKQRADQASAEAKRRQQLTESCKAGSEKMNLATSEMKAGKPQRAFEALQDCRDYLSDQSVKALYLKAMSTARDQQVAETKRIAAAEKTEKKKHGVHIGMTQQDVLDSSWGQPERVNRTTTARGTHEQWVYGGHNYLYFEDGVLTSIQN